MHLISYSLRLSLNRRLWAFSNIKNIKGIGLEMLKKSKDLIPEKRILRIILVIRGEKVILDSDLAALYGVETRRLNEQVRRNIDKFPEDFMFQLSKEEFANLKSQIATSSLSLTTVFAYLSMISFSKTSLTFSIHLRPPENNTCMHHNMCNIMYKIYT